MCVVQLCSCVVVPGTVKVANSNGLSCRRHWPITLLGAEGHSLSIFLPWLEFPVEDQGAWTNSEKNFYNHHD